MRKLKLFLSLLMLFAFSLGNVWAADYKKTALADITSSDVVIIVGNNGSLYALSNDKGTGSAPAAVSVSATNDVITTDATNILWNIAKDGNNLTIYPNGTTETWLYCTATNNGVRVGTNANKVFVIDNTNNSNNNAAQNDYLYNSATNRWLGVYNSSDWRCYTTIGANIKNQALSFYVLQEEGGDDVTVKTLKSIALSGQTTSFYQNAAFAFDGTCTATYSVTKNDVAQADEQKVVTPTSVSSPDMTTLGNKEVTVTFTDGEVSKEAKYTITVTEAPAAVNYEKVDAEPADWSGEYILVYEADETNARVWKGADAANNYAEATISAGVIAAPEGAAVLTIAKVAESSPVVYTIKVGEKYIGQTSDANGMKIQDAAINNSISYNTTDAAVDIVASSAHLRYNSASSSYFRYYKSATYSGQKKIQLYKKVDGTPQKQAAGLAYATSAYLVKANGSLETPTLSNENGLTVTYASSNTEVAEVDASTGAVTIKAAGKAEITASSEETDTYKAGSAKYTIYVANHLGTEEDPYEVADARMAIDWNAYITNVYAKGIVSKIVEEYSSQYGNITYNISTDGTTTADQLQAYRGKGQNGDNFTSADDVQVGDEVVLYGTLKKYNSTYEFDANNQLVSLNRDKQAAGISYATTAFIVKKGAEFTAPALVNPNTLAVTYSSDAAWAVVDATTGVLTLNATEGKATITASFEGNASYNAGSAKYSIYFTDHAGTAEDPLTVAEAREVIDNLETIAGVYVAGKVSEIVTAYSEQYGNISYNISTDGTTTTDQLQAYRGKAANGENFTSADDVQVGDEVVVYGNLKKYNSTYEFDANNQLYSLNRPTTPEEPVVSEWTEIKFAEAVAADALAADATFTAENSEFALTITDNNNKMSIDGNNANFGTADAYDTYSHRLKAGGTSSASNNMTLTIPADGTLRIAVRSASGDATNRNLLLTQNETELYNAIVKDADAVLLADEITKVYPYVTVNVKAGSVNITYPNGGLNFYSFAFKEGASEDPLEPEPVVGNKYKKVTATSDITDGKYLIVYEDGSLAFNGGLETLDAVSNTIAVEIANDRIAATDATNAAAFTIAATAGTIKSANGLYIGQTSDANGMAANDEALANTISIDEDGNAVILASGGAYLRYNATSGQERFRYFKSSTYTNQKTIALYKLVMEEEIPEWAEIVFPEAKGIDELAADADFTLNYSDFKLTLSDLGNSASIDLPSSAAKFGTAEDGNEYTGRLKTGGSSNSMTLTIPADGLLRIAVRSANSTDARHLVLTQEEENLYNQIVQDADKSTDGYYPYVFVNVKAGTVSVTYPDGGLNFYAFAFNEGASIDVEPEEPETPATTKNVVILAEYNNEFYAMSTNNSSNAFAAIKVVKDGENIVVTSEEEKAAIQWTMTSNETSATFQNAAEKYLTAASGSTNLNLGDAECAWKWYAGEGKNCYSIENEDETKLRTFLYYKNNIFKNYALTNIGGNYSGVTEVKEIAAENIIVVEPDKYVVSYNANGGSLIEGEEVIANAEYTEGAQVTVAANVYEVEGKVFAGWKYGETTYSAGQTFDMPAEDVELVAQWATISTDNVVILAKCQGQWYAVKGEAGSSNHTVAAVPVEYKDNTIYLIESKRASITWERTTVGAQASFKNGENYLTGKTSDSNDLDLKAEESWWNYNTDLATYQTHSLHSLLYSSQVGLFKNYKTSNKSEDGESGTYSALPIVVPAVFADPDYAEVRSGLEVGRYYTVCLDKAVDAVRGASFWTLSSRNTAETEAYLEEVDPTTAEAGTPFIIQATDTKLEVVYTGAATTTAGTNGALHGTLTYMSAADLAAAGTNIYMLYNNALRPVGTNNHLDANRAYINYNELNPVTEAPQPAPGRRVRAVPMQQNTATGIDELNGSEAPAKVLINGQLFILRGEKMYDAKGLLVK